MLGAQDKKSGALVEHNSLKAAATLMLLAINAALAAQGEPQEEVLLPEVEVTGAAAARLHPQEGYAADRLLGCVEVITPSGGGGLGGTFQARNAPEGTPVIPNLNDPGSAADYWRRGPTNYQHRATPPGQEGRPGCQR